MLKKSIFYSVAVLVIFGGQFLVHRDLVSGKPPAIAQTTLQGNPAMSNISHGPAIIYFWGQWCGICRNIQSGIDNTLKDYPGLSVAIRSGDNQQLAEYMGSKQLNWPTVNDNDGNISRRYGVSAVPAIFILNSGGEIVFTTVGYTSEWGLRLRLWLAKFV